MIPLSENFYNFFVVINEVKKKLIQFQLKEKY